MAEVECGSHFDFMNQNHIQWLNRRITIRFYMGAKYFGYYLEDDTPVGFASISGVGI